MIAILKNVLTLLLLLLFTSVTFLSADDSNTSSARYSLKSTEMATLQLFMKDKTLKRSKFTQTKNIQGFSSPLISSGVFYFFPEIGISWKNEKPITSTLTISKTHFIKEQQSHKSHTTLDDNPIAKKVSQIFLQLFGADFNALQDQFTFSFSHDLTNTTSIEDLNGQEWSITLAPKDDSLKAFIQNISLSGRDYLSHIVLREGEDSTKITLYKIAESMDKITDEEKKWFEN